MGWHPAALLVDDGELNDVADLLAELGADALRLWGGAERAGWREPRCLLMATARRALALPRPLGARQPGCMRVAVAARGALAIGPELRARGFEHIVSRPVHPEAMRQLVQGALAADHEQRAQPRLPVGLPVRWRSGLCRRDALLAELSPRGCSLVVYGRRMSCGPRVQVELPAEVAGRRAPALHARKVRFHRRREDLYTIALVFERLAPAARRALERALGALHSGPPVSASPASIG